MSQITTISQLQRITASCPKCKWKIDEKPLLGMLRVGKTIYSYQCDNCGWGDFSLYIKEHEIEAILRRQELLNTYEEYKAKQDNTTGRCPKCEQEEAEQ